MSAKKKMIFKYVFLLLIGAGLYYEVELNWRYFTGHLPVHWSMAVLGGVLFIILGGINNWFPWEMSLPKQALAGMITVTAAEFIAGIVLNIWLGLGIWDYSHLPGNVMGQICPQFMAAWFSLSCIAIVLDDVFRWRFFGEQKPHYKLL